METILTRSQVSSSTSLYRYRQKETSAFDLAASFSLSLSLVFLFSHFFLFRERQEIRSLASEQNDQRLWASRACHLDIRLPRHKHNECRRTVSFRVCSFVHCTVFPLSLSRHVYIHTLLTLMYPPYSAPAPSRETRDTREFVLYTTTWYMRAPVGTSGCACLSPVSLA